MQFKSLLLPLVVLATGSNIQASTTAFSTFYTRDVALAGRTLVARTTTTQVTGTTVTVTKTVAKPTTTSSSSDCCECITALAEGVACAAAILEEGCNILADISCIIDATAFGQAVPKCLSCIGF